MSASAGHNGSAGRNAAGADAVRVVLVGRTGLDGAMRQDRSVELLRAGTALEAIGELADAGADDHPDAPTPTTLVVSPESVGDDAVERFVSAVKIVSPEARVLSAGKPREGFDGVVPPGADADSARRAVRGQPPISRAERASAEREAPAARPPARPQASAAAKAPAQAPVRRGDDAAPMPPRPGSGPRSSGPAPEPPHGSALDDAPLGAVIAGKDPVATALEGISARLGARAAYVAAAADAQAPAGGVPVTHGARLMGWLSAPGAAGPRLEVEAAWLAGWIVLSAQQEQLRRAAFTDELTGAWNRRYFNRFLSAAIEQGRAARHAVTLLYFDVDDFKRYNDRYGHAAGDEILTETVRLLNSVIRPSDRVCRIGGDEFAVVFFDPEGPRNTSAASLTGPQSIAQIAARFQKQICEHRFPKLADQAPGTLTISGGMATFPWDGSSVDELLVRADELALTSKRQGKNVITFGPGAERACRVHFDGTEEGPPEQN